MARNPGRGPVTRHNIKPGSGAMLKPYAHPLWAPSRFIIKRFAKFERHYETGRPKRCEAVQAMRLQLTACTMMRRCWSATCFVCTRLVQSQLTFALKTLTEELAEQGEELVFVSVIPTFIPETDEDSIWLRDPIKVRERIRNEFSKAGVTFLVGGLDLSVNWDQRASVPETERFSAHPSIHAWCLALKREMTRKVRRMLKAAFPANDVTPVPIKVQKWNGKIRAFPYMLKPNFGRRISIERPARKREGTERTTRKRSLTWRLEVKLRLLLRGMTVRDRLFTIGRRIGKGLTGLQFHPET